MYAAPELQQPAATANVTGQIGEWLICEDQQGEYYIHEPSQQQFDQPPAELLALLPPQ